MKLGLIAFVARSAPSSSTSVIDGHAGDLEDRHASPAEELDSHQQQARGERQQRQRLRKQPHVLRRRQRPQEHGSQQRRRRDKPPSPRRQPAALAGRSPAPAARRCREQGSARREQTLSCGSTTAATPCRTHRGARKVRRDAEVVVQAGTQFEDGLATTLGSDHELVVSSTSGFARQQSRGRAAAPTTPRLVASLATIRSGGPGPSAGCPRPRAAPARSPGRSTQARLSVKWERISVPSPSKRSARGTNAGFESRNAARAVTSPATSSADRGARTTLSTPQFT